MTFKLYGAGGAGINIASRLESLRDGSKGVLLDGFSISYLDTSDSNVDHNKINKDNLYLIEGANGSGKNRAENYSIIKEQIKRILLDHKPQDFNVVIHSLSGGSGSVIGPLIANELLDQGKDVVVIIVGSTDSTIEINNSIKTIKSYAGISAKQKKPVVAIYYENNENTPRKEVDSRVESVVMLLSAFLSKNNHELDYSDIHNFLNYPKVTPHDPGLVIARFYHNKIEPDHNCHAIACLTLAGKDQDTSTGITIDYQATGIIGDSAAASTIMNVLPNHMTILDGCVTEILDRLEKKIKEIENIQAAKVSRRIKFDGADDDGMVL